MSKSKIFGGPVLVWSANFNSYLKGVVTRRINNQLLSVRFHFKDNPQYKMKYNAMGKDYTEHICSIDELRLPQIHKPTQLNLF